MVGWFLVFPSDVSVFLHFLRYSLIIQGYVMSNGRPSKLWIVNVTSFVLIIVLFSTGLINWLVLPRGYEGRGNFWVSLRHFFIALHEWAGLIFMATIVIHIVLHWPYVKSNLKKYGIIN